jgi:hypothetical protein
MNLSKLAIQEVDRDRSICRSMEIFARFCTLHHPYEPFGLKIFDAANFKAEPNCGRSVLSNDIKLSKENKT